MYIFYALLDYESKIMHSMTKDIMDDVIRQTLEGGKSQ